MSGTTITLIIIAAVVGWAIMTYNRFVQRKNVVQEAWSGIDVQLKRRSNLVPNLVEVVKGYAKHEAETLSKVTQQRTGNSVAERGEHEAEVSKAIQSLLAVAEAYPDLKANENFLDLQNNLDEIETNIQSARRFYNGAVRDLNILVESFPSNLIANTFNFSAAQFFEIELASERQVPQVKF